MRAQAQPDAEGKGPDVIITEIGGTAGDIESQPFLEAAGELKTKPIRHSAAALRSIGIAPDALVQRTDRPLPEGIKGIVAHVRCGP